MKLLFIIILQIAIIVTFVSCGDSGKLPNQNMQDIQNHDDNSSKSKNELSQHELKNRPVVTKTRNIINDINDGTIERTDGLSEINQLIDDNFTENGIESLDDDEYDDSFEEDNQIIQELVDVIFELESGNQIENLVMILGLDAFTKDEFANDHISIAGDIKKLFETLTEATSKDATLISPVDDRFLVLYLDNKKVQYELQTPNALSSLEAIRYFKERIEKLFNNESKTMAYNIFSNYCLLSKVVNSDSTLVSIFAPLLPFLEIKKETSYLMKTSFVRILGVFNRRDEKLLFANEILNFKYGTNFINSAFALIDSSIEMLQFSGHGDFDIAGCFFVIDEALKFFDKNNESYLSMNREKWIKLFDKRYEKMNSFFNILKTENVSLILKNDELKNIPSHPYAQIYFYRAMFENDINKQYYPITVSFKEKQLEEDLSLESYRDYFNQIELIRFEMEHFYEQNDEAKLRQSYNNIRQLLVKAINFRENKNLTINDYLKMKATSNLKKLNEEFEELAGVIYIDYCKKMDGKQKFCSNEITKPGIFVINGKDLHITGAEIRFHPMTLIYAPGQEIFISADNLVSPWIDVSGGLPTQTLPESYHAYSNFLKPTQGYNKGQEKWFVNWRCNSNQVHKIQQPPRQNPGANGNNAGKIHFKLSHSLEGSVLLAAFGSDGLDGHNGHNSRAYKSSWRYDIGRTVRWTTGCRQVCSVWGACP